MKRNDIILVSLIMILLGMGLVLFSTSIGNVLGSQAIFENGGALDTNTYLRIIDESAQTARIIGIMIFVLGCIGVQKIDFTHVKDTAEDSMK